MSEVYLGFCLGSEHASLSAGIAVLSFEENNPVSGFRMVSFFVFFVLRLGIGFVSFRFHCCVEIESGMSG